MHFHSTHNKVLLKIHDSFDSCDWIFCAKHSFILELVESLQISMRYCLKALCQYSERVFWIYLCDMLFKVKCDSSWIRNPKNMKRSKLQVGVPLSHVPCNVVYIPLFHPHFMFHIRSWQKHRQRKMRMGMDVVLQFAYYQQHQQLSKSNMKSKWSKVLNIQTFLVWFVFVWFCVNVLLGNASPWLWFEGCKPIIICWYDGVM